VRLLDETYQGKFRLSVDPGGLPTAAKATSADPRGTLAAAFREYGVEVEALSPDEAAARLRARPTVAVPLAQALDSWAGWSRHKGDDDRALKLWSLASAIDPDPWRVRLRRHVASRQLDDLHRLAQSKDAAVQPPASQLLLAASLEQAGQLEKALAI